MISVQIYKVFFYHPVHLMPTPRAMGLKNYQWSKKFVLCAFVYIQYHSVTDRRTDRQTRKNNIAFYVL